MSHFYYRNRMYRIDSNDANQPLLSWLRGNGYVGTKAGCASGDCGACTVVAVQLEQDRLEYRSINSCITLLAQLDGQYLITVEDLAADGVLHPVQQAMIDFDGSQCGFCTPGFIMSLFALYHRSDKANLSRHQIDSALGGNLCRCTGYHSIIEAAFSSCNNPIADAFDQLESHLTECLLSISPKDSLESVLERLAEQPIRPVCGGTDLGLEVSQLQRDLDVIAINRIDELHHINSDDDYFYIGAASTYTKVQPIIGEDYPVFAEIINRIGSLQIRNQGGLGGNIANASPIGDTPPMLMALNAELELVSRDSSRIVNINDFFQGYRQTLLERGEIIKQIIIPRAKANQCFNAIKLSKRFDDDISTVLIATNIELEGAKVINCQIAFGGMAATPIRAVKAEKALIGQTIESAIDNAIAAIELAPISDVRASKEYRLAMAKTLLRDALLPKQDAIHDFKPVRISQ